MAAIDHAPYGHQKIRMNSYGDTFQPELNDADPKAASLGLNEAHTARKAS